MGLDPTAAPSSSALDPWGAMLSRHAPPPGNGALKGVRLCVKDNMEVAGEPFTAGHPLYAARQGRDTAPAVMRLLAAGASFVGMAATDAGGFGMTTDAVENPVFSGCTVGGSSGGIAAAVAGGLADLGLGTDTGGSIRVPAACTGLYGFKPSVGRVPLDGVFPLAPSLDHVGLLAGDLGLLSRGADLLLGETLATGFDGEEDGRPLVVAVEPAFPPSTDSAIAACFKRVVSHLEAAGMEIRLVSLPDREALVADFGDRVVREAAPFYRDLPVEAMERLGQAARRAMTSLPTARAVPAECDARLAQARERYEACLAKVDMLLSPTLLVPPPARGVHWVETPAGRRNVLELFLAGTAFANVAGVPALAMPCPQSEAPYFSLHVVAARESDRRLLRNARQLLRALRADKDP